MRPSSPLRSPLPLCPPALLYPSTLPRTEQWLPDINTNINTNNVTAQPNDDCATRQADQVLA
ncbi:MAG: hypothetical protein ACRDZY_21035 [Acidimicrobiales bacterium]